MREATIRRVWLCLNSTRAWFQHYHTLLLSGLLRTCPVTQHITGTWGAQPERGRCCWVRAPSSYTCCTPASPTATSFHVAKAQKSCHHLIQ